MMKDPEGAKVSQAVSRCTVNCPSLNNVAQSQSVEALSRPKLDGAKSHPESALASPALNMAQGHLLQVPANLVCRHPNSVPHRYCDNLIRECNTIFLEFAISHFLESRKCGLALANEVIAILPYYR